MPTICTLPDVCAKVNCMEQDVDALWDKVFGADERVFIATGNIGVPTNFNISTVDQTYNNADLEDYTRGAALINFLEPAGLFVTGGIDFDNINVITPGYPATYSKIKQEAKIITGFSKLLNDKKFFPVMGDTDFWPTRPQAYTPQGTIVDQIGRTVLRMFDYLGAAQRYYSVYDDASNTEFFILSEGRYSDFYASVADGFVYANDTLIGGEQHTWFVQKCNASPAGNKVVIFSSPFTSIINSRQGVRSVGPANIFAGFQLWDFESLGVKLIINGRSGNSFHLKRGAVNIVNASAFSRTKTGITESGAGEASPITPITYGQAGWVVDYFSYRPISLVPTVAVPYSGTILYDKYIIPKQEMFKMTCTTDGINCEFISYNTTLSTFQEVINSMTVEHSFSIQSL